MEVNDVFYWSAIGGISGGLASFMLLAYNKFESIPSVQDLENSKKYLRKRFLFLRVGFGFLTASIFSFWFMEDCLAGNLSWSKLTFYSAIIGFSTNILQTISNACSKILAKSVGKFV